MRIPTWLQVRLQRRHGGAIIFVLIFLGVGLLTRLALLAKSASLVAFNLGLGAAFAWGLLFDLATALLAVAPLVVVLILLPERFNRLRWAPWLWQAALFAALGVLVFGAVAEWLFWDEFGARFNFIAVDYLVYTQEVMDNIRESYPLPQILAGVLAAALIGSWAFARTGLVACWCAAETEPFRRRLAAGGAWLAAAVVAGAGLELDDLPGFANNYQRELAKNGLWSMCAAFRNNELDYDQFYRTLPLDEAFTRLHASLAADRGRRLSPDPRDTLRLVRGDGPEIRPNVIQITVESLSADFLGIFNPASRLTPELDAIAPRSLVFRNFYATGTRTDRGMEALTLSVPPTPGRSLVKRPQHDDLFTLGSVFRSRGYDTAFLYGGYGYFDNMNHFFGRNGYRVIDRASVAGRDITFANAWGACDEDLLRWTLREADAVHAAGKPFHFFVMTTSNHRPFTYPDNRIDLPSKVSGRDGAVKYTDFAIGQFLRQAAEHPWFRHTVFVIVADHCASSAGIAALPVENYHIPLIIFAPGGQVAPGRVDDLMSQVDYAPTLLGLLNWSYASRFFGWDIRHTSGDRRAFIGNYQRLGLFADGRLSVLMPVRRAEEFDYDAATHVLTPRQPSFTEQTAAYYQTASYLHKNRLFRALSPQEQARHAATVATSPAATAATSRATTAQKPSAGIGGFEASGR